MKVSLIAAMTEERLIGQDNRLPWYLPRDLAWFKRQTVYKPIIMGRKTYQSIGHPLPKRQNIVLSREPPSDSRVIWCHSIDAALSKARGAEEVMVIGGATLYNQLLTRADRLYLTLIAAKLHGDCYFPSYTNLAWFSLLDEYYSADNYNPYPCRFIILERVV